LALKEADSPDRPALRKWLETHRNAKYQIPQVIDFYKQIIEESR
jgi:hypothetical protein